MEETFLVMNSLVKLLNKLLDVIFGKLLYTVPANSIKLKVNSTLSTSMCVMLYNSPSYIKLPVEMLEGKLKYKQTNNSFFDQQSFRKLFRIACNF